MHMQCLMVQLEKGMIKLDSNLDIIILVPKIKIIAPWRIWKLKSRTDLINYAKKRMVFRYQKIKKVHLHFLLTIIYSTLQLKEKLLENPKNSPPEFIFQRTVSPEKAPNKSTFVTINFKNGDPSRNKSKKIKTFQITSFKLNQLAGRNGIGRVDLVENRFLGIKSRGDL